MQSESSESECSGFLLQCNIDRCDTVPLGGGLPTKAQFDRIQRRSFMKCTVDWVPDSGMAFVAETGSGHLLTMDGAPDGGGRNLAPRPMETVLAGTGACTAYDVVLILRRGRHDVRSCRLQVRSERAPEDPKVFAKIHLHFVIGADVVPAAAVERAIALSHDR